MALRLIVPFGPPGAGKGTLAQLIAEQAGFVHLSTGQAMRNWAEGSRPEQVALKAGLARGEYGSDELAAQIVAEFLADLPAEAPGAILDGFPRNPAQLRYFLPVLRAQDPVAVVLSASRAALEARLGRRSVCTADGYTSAGLSRCPRCAGPMSRRADDEDLAVLATRLDTYERQVGPTILAWQVAGLPLIEASAEGPIETMSDLAESLTV